MAVGRRQKIKFMPANTTEKFLLKDYLFNRIKVEKLAGEIKSVFKEFEDEKFVNEVIGKFDSLELKQRINWIAVNLRKYLPENFSVAVELILSALPAKLDESKTDNDFGDFIYAPYGEFIAKFGQDKNDLKVSLNAIYEITQRFSCEDAVRYFLNNHEKETYFQILKWTKDKNYHVRRLCSEGTRPKLPWSQKIKLTVTKTLPILDNLFFDKTRYVTRSVANHMNDISKNNPNLVLDTLYRWENSGKQSSKEMKFIITQSLRTLIKLGNQRAFELLNHKYDIDIKIMKFKFVNKNTKIGESLIFSLEVAANEAGEIVIDYILVMQNKKGKMHSKKVYKFKKIKVEKGVTYKVEKKHAFKKDLTTRTYYPGVQKILIQINGRLIMERKFELTK